MSLLIKCRVNTEANLTEIHMLEHMLYRHVIGYEGIHPLLKVFSVDDNERDIYFAETDKDKTIYISWAISGNNSEIALSAIKQCYFTENDLSVEKRAMTIELYTGKNRLSGMVSEEDPMDLNAIKKITLQRVRDLYNHMSVEIVETKSLDASCFISEPLLPNLKTKGVANMFYVKHYRLVFDTTANPFSALFFETLNISSSFKYRVMSAYATESVVDIIVYLGTGLSKVARGIKDRDVALAIYSEMYRDDWDRLLSARMLSTGSKNITKYLSKEESVLKIEEALSSLSDILLKYSAKAS